MSRLTVEELQRLLADDEAGFVDALARHPGFPILDFVETLQRRPDLAAAVRERLPDYRVAEYDTWLTRRVLPLRSRDLVAFCRLATEVVRDHHPDFPPLPDAMPPVVGSYQIATVRHADYRDRNGHGWELEVEDEEDGPAEVIHLEHWTAIARGADFGQRIRLESVQRWVEVWAEPRVSEIP